MVVASCCDASRRPGDLARIEENVTSSGLSKKAKSKKQDGATTKTKSAEGVVYKVNVVVDIQWTS